MDIFQQVFEAAIPELRTEMMTAFGITKSALGFRSVWENFEEVVIPILSNFFINSRLKVPSQNIKPTKSKSAYPDLKVEYQARLYAIDVKSGEDTRDPWYDISRIDTYEKSHLQKYAGEYSVVIKWGGRDKTNVTNIFIEPTYRTVGFRAASNGVLYRPYDGKMRPKPWKDFERGFSYWNDLDHFRQGLARSIAYRRRSLMVEWYKAMNATQRGEIHHDIAEIDAGELITLDTFDEGAEE